MKSIKTLLAALAIGLAVNFSSPTQAHAQPPRPLSLVEQDAYTLDGLTALNAVCAIYLGREPVEASIKHYREGQDYVSVLFTQAYGSSYPETYRSITGQTPTEDFETHLGAVSKNLNSQPADNVLGVCSLTYKQLEAMVAKLQAIAKSRALMN